MPDPTPTLPPLSVSDLFALIGEQQARIVQLARALEQAQATASKPPLPFVVARGDVPEKSEAGG